MVSKLSCHCEKIKELDQQIAVEKPNLGNMRTAGRTLILVQEEHEKTCQMQ